MMKKLILVMLSIITISLLGAFADKNSQNNLHAEHKKSVKQNEIKYLCPMHPQITSNKPGKCSICGMDLVLAEETEEQEEPNNQELESPSLESTPKDKWEDVDTKNNKRTKTKKNSEHDGHQRAEPSGHTKFKLSLNKQQMIGVKLNKVARRKLFKTIRAPGRVAFDPELYTAQSEYLEALRQWKRVEGSPIKEVKRSTQEMINSAKIRLKVLGLSNEQIGRLGRKGKQSEGLLLTGKGQENWVYADVFEMDLPYIKKGLSVEITANFLQGTKLIGKVISVDEVINPETRTAKVRIRLKGGNKSIRPESYVSVSIYAPVGEHLTVPLDALMDTGQEIFVFIKKPKSNFEPRIVKVLLETKNFAAILDGVHEGETVVVGGNFMLDSESRLRAVIKGMSDRTSEHQH